MIIKGMWRLLAFSWNCIMALFGALSARGRAKKLARENERKRGVTECGNPEAISILLKDITANGKVVISGNDYESPSPWRDAVAARAVAKIAQDGVGVIVLHCGNDDLIGRMQGVIDRSRLIIVDDGNKIYDPLRDLSVADCLEVLVGSRIGEDYDLHADARRYLEGLILSSKYCLKRIPSLYMLKRLAGAELSSLKNQLQQCLDINRITQAQYDECSSMLVGGISGRTQLRSYINELYGQFSDIASDNTAIADAQMISIGRAIRDGKILALNLQSITNYRMGYGLLMNELNKALAHNNRAYLAIDNLEIAECSDLYRKVTTTGGKLGTCISVNDLFAKCESKQEKLNTVVSSSECCFVFRHVNGDTTEAWQKKFGSYEKIEVIRNEMSGRMRPSPFMLFSGSNSGRGSMYTPKIEPRVKSNEIQNMPQGVAYVTVKQSETILHCPLQEA